LRDSKRPSRKEKERRVNNNFKSEFKLESRDEKWIEEQG
jgi:hypothetical protein